MISSIHRYSHVLLALALLVTSSAAGAQDIDALYEQGQSAFEAGRFEEARSKFASVWEQRKSYDVAAVLAQAELQVGRNADAAHHLAYAAAHFPVSASTDVRKKIEAAFAEVRGKVGALKVDVSPASATLKVNGRAYAEAERGELIFVEPGQVTVEVSADEHEPAKQTIELKKGETREVKLPLVLKSKPAERSFLAPGIAFGVGGAGLIVGVVAGAVTAAKSDSLKTTCGDALVCPTGVRSEGDAALAAAHASTVGFVVAGVGAAVGVTLLLLPSKPAKTARMELVVGPSFTGVKGAF